MKTAVSIPDELFEETDRLAASLRTSRSRLVRGALREYLDRHAPDRETEAMNTVLADVREESDPFVHRAADTTLRRSEW